MAITELPPSLRGRDQATDQLPPSLMGKLPPSLREGDAPLDLNVLPEYAGPGLSVAESATIQAPVSPLERGEGLKPLVEATVISAARKVRGIAQLSAKIPFGPPHLVGTEMMGQPQFLEPPKIKKAREKYQEILNEPFAIEQQMIDSRGKRIADLMEKGDLTGAIVTTFIDTSFDIMIELAFMRGVLRGLPGQATGTAGHLLYAGKAGLLRAATTPGPDKERATTALLTTAYMATPALSSLAPAKVLAVGSDILLNSGVSAVTGQHKEAIKRGKAQAEAEGKPERAWQYSVINLLPIVGTDIGYSLFVKSARNKNDPARIVKDTKPVDLTKIYQSINEMGKVGMQLQEQLAAGRAGAAIGKPAPTLKLPLVASGEIVDAKTISGVGDKFVKKLGLKGEIKWKLGGVSEDSYGGWKTIGENKYELTIHPESGGAVRSQIAIKDTMAHELTHLLRNEQGKPKQTDYHTSDFYRDWDSVRESLGLEVTPIQDLTPIEELTRPVPKATIGRRFTGVPRPTKDRGFVKTVRESPRTAAEVAAGVTGVYEPITNKATLSRAQSLVNKDINAARDIVFGDKPLDAQTSAVAQVLMRRYQNAGDYDNAVQIVERIAERGTIAGQGIQTLSMWNILTPEGMLYYTNKLYSKANKRTGLVEKWFGIKKAKLTPELAAEITKQVKDIQAMKDPTAKQNATRSLLTLVTEQVPPRITDYIDEFRYNNVLSSPRTWQVNFFNNFLQTIGTRPLTKTAEGAIDAFRATLTGTQRQVYLREVPAYYRGMVNSFGKAVTGAIDVLRGKRAITRPDIPVTRDLITGKQRTLLPGAFQIPTRIMEAGDIFFMELLRGGEARALRYRQRRGAPVGDIPTEADALAKYTLFRAPIDPEGTKTGQGKVLRIIDTATNAVYYARKVPGVNWFVMFVRTPMNLFKQMIEYSPAGFATAIGAKNVQQQLAKAFVGSIFQASGAWLVANTETTTSAPRGLKEKEAFYAAGRQPWSIRLGDKWLSFNQMPPPIAITLATAAYVKEKFADKTMTVAQEKGFLKTVAGFGEFYTNQTYLKGIGDLVKAAQGDEAAVGNLPANFGRQLIPMSSLARWVAQLIDPIVRNPGKNTIKSIQSAIPFLSKYVPSFKTPSGEPAKRSFKWLNAIQPFAVRKVDTEFEREFRETKEDKAFRRIRARELKILRDVDEGRITDEQADKLLDKLDKEADAFEKGLPQ